MRLSTAALHEQGVANILKQQTALARIQNQLSSNSKMLTAADDPAAAARALALDQNVANIGNWQSNIGLAQHRLGLEENALSGITDTLARVRELLVQANSGTQSAASRQSIVTELQQHYEQLLAYANSDDGAGRYLFAGSADASAPFSATATGASYAGDQTPRLIAVGAQRQIADGDTGAWVFGSGGANDLFAFMKSAITDVGATPLDSTQMAQHLTQLQTLQDHVSTVRGSVGNRLSALDSVTATLDSQDLLARSELSQIRDLDIAEASSRLVLTQTVLQAAQQSYQRVQGLSLFDYLR